VPIPLVPLLLLAAALVTPAAHAEPEDGKRFKDWTARCEAPEGGGPRACYLFQNILLKKANRQLLHVAVGYQPRTDTAAAVFTLPLGVSLPGGLSLTVDEGKPLRMRYERCDANGCRAPLTLNDGLIKSLKGGRWARVAFFDSNRREVSVPVSLLGFTAGFNALK
jgi:invasion protein IalB